jgi:hypothetical protein
MDLVKSLEIRIPHALEKAEVRRRLDAAVDRARRDYADKVSQLEAVWETEDSLALEVTVLGMEIDGTVANEPGHLVISIEMPGMLSMFAGQIRNGVEERIGGLLSAPT